MDRSEKDRALGPSYSAWSGVRTLAGPNQHDDLELPKPPLAGKRCRLHCSGRGRIVGSPGQNDDSLGRSGTALP